MMDGWFRGGPRASIKNAVIESRKENLDKLHVFGTTPSKSIALMSLKVRQYDTSFSPEC